MQNVIDILKERGLIGKTTSDEVRDKLASSVRVYCGFDPTADSLHLGNMVLIMGLAWFQRCGHTPVAIVGGATGMIGDPSGKSTERNLLDLDTLQRNAESIRADIERILLRDASLAKPLFFNNLDWFRNFSFIDFLRDVGKHFRVGVMLSKESVQARLRSEDGISFTEFSYQLLQGYDFYHLFQHHGVTVQLGGSDQWGNITSGLDLIKKITGKTVYGVTLPLLTKSNGQKFGKSERGAIWMNPDKLSAYELYQQLIRIEDADVVKLLRMLTFVDMARIHDVEYQMKQPGYSPNSAQKLLAREVVELIHGDEGLKKALAATEGMRPGHSGELDVALIESLITSVPSKCLANHDVIHHKLIDVIARAGFLPSKSEARRMIKGGGLYINNCKITDDEYVISEADVIGSKFVLLAFGKKNKAVIQVGA